MLPRRVDLGLTSASPAPASASASQRAPASACGLAHTPIRLVDAVGRSLIAFSGTERLGRLLKPVADVPVCESC